MDRYWLLTWTTYGAWLPGDSRGFVTVQRDRHGRKFIHNVPGTDYDARNDRLSSVMAKKMKSPSVRLTSEQAQLLGIQFLETAAIRSWKLLTGSIMANHVHLVVGVIGDPDHADILGSFKNYGSRVLSKDFGNKVARTWSTESGSRRKLPTEESVLAAARYVRDQAFPLWTWIDPQIQTELGANGPKA